MRATRATVRLDEDVRLDAIFAALADPTRRRILARLAYGAAPVGEIAAPLSSAMSLQAVSKHLTVLERAGLVRRERDGRVRRCHLDARPLEGAVAFIDFYRAFWEGTLDKLADYVEHRQREEEPQ
jgi:DNA-binding transcriptional ArsR family regulator